MQSTESVNSGFVTLVVIGRSKQSTLKMASIQHAPRQWCLTKTETVNSFESWQQNLIYTLSLDTNFTQFLSADAKWEKKCAAQPLRGFTDDNATAPSGRTALQQVYMLELMLGQIANFCPVISRNTIVKRSTSLPCIWQTIRLHYGFQSTGAHFLDLADIHLEPDERPEDLYQRLLAFIEDNMLKQGSAILHHGEAVAIDEELSPSLENMVVLTWLRLINTALPKLVKQRYGTELRSRTLASIKPEIALALDSLLDEISSTNVMQSSTIGHTQNRLMPSIKHCDQDMTNDDGSQYAAIARITELPPVDSADDTPCKVVKRKRKKNENTEEDCNVNERQSPETTHKSKKKKKHKKQVDLQHVVEVENVRQKSPEVSPELKKKCKTGNVDNHNDAAVSMDAFSRLQPVESTETQQNEIITNANGPHVTETQTEAVKSPKDVKKRRRRRRHRIRDTVSTPLPELSPANAVCYSASVPIVNSHTTDHRRHVYFDNDQDEVTCDDVQSQQNGTDTAQENESPHLSEVVCNDDLQATGLQDNTSGVFNLRNVVLRSNKVFTRNCDRMRTNVDDQTLAAPDTVTGVDEAAAEEEPIRTEPAKDYSQFDLLHGPPRTNDRIAYKILEVSENYTPEVSAYKEATVLSYSADTGVVELMTEPTAKRRPGKFDLTVESETEILTNEVAENEAERQVTLCWPTLLESRLLV